MLRLYLVFFTRHTYWGWSGGAMVLGKLPVPGRPAILITVGPGRVAQSVGHLTRKSGFDTRSGNILSFLHPLFQEGQLSVTGESMRTKDWLTA